MSPTLAEAIRRESLIKGSSSTMLTIFDGRVEDLRPMLTEERFAEDWEPRIKSRFGLPMASFNALVLQIEMGIKKVKNAKTE